MISSILEFHRTGSWNHAKAVEFHHPSSGLPIHLLKKLVKDDKALRNGFNDGEGPSNKKPRKKRKRNGNNNNSSTAATSKSARDGAGDAS